MINKNISFYILMKYPPFKKAVEENDKETFEKIIYDAGIDTSLPYDVETVSHRPYEDKPFVFTGPLVQGVERVDSDWLKSELCSWENKRSCIKDPELRAELAQIGRTGCADKTWQNEETAKAVLKQEKNKEY